MMDFNEDQSAVVIINNFKANSVDLLQPMDLSVNKPAKDYFRRLFKEWCSQQISHQIQGKDIDSIELETINLGLPILKE